MLKFLFSKTFLINLILAGLFAALIIWGIFKFIDNYTLHGKTISTPSLEGLTINEVEELLTEKKLRYTILDSIYVSDADKGIVLEQDPVTDDLVKENRIIYITTSKVIPPKISMPNVVDMSLRLAAAKLESYGLTVNTKYMAAECVSCVLKQKINGKEVNPGDKIEKGSIVLLTVGRGTSNERVLVPYLINLTKEEAERKLMESSLNLGFNDYENCLCKTAKDTLYAKIYKQSPIRSQSIAVNMGSAVDLYFTCDTSLIDFNPPVIDSTGLDTIKID